MTGGSRAWTTLNLTYMMYGMKTRDPDSERSVQLLRFSSHVLGSEGEHGTKVVFKLEISGAQERTDNVSRNVEKRSSSWSKRLAKDRTCTDGDCHRLKETMGREQPKAPESDKKRGDTG